MGSDEGTFVFCKMMDEVLALFENLSTAGSATTSSSSSASSSGKTLCDSHGATNLLLRPLPVKSSVDRLEVPRNGPPAFKISTLQDFEAGRSLEIEALLDSIIEIAKVVRSPVPTMEIVTALVKLRAQQRGLAY